MRFRPSAALLESIVLSVKPASYYADLDSARAAAESAITPEERAAESWWESLPASERTMLRRRHASEIFAEGAPDLCIIAYRARVNA